MSGFLNSIKQSFSGPQQELNETSKAILDVENKKKAINQAAISEQGAIRIKINNEYMRIGETAYRLYGKGNFEVEELSDMFATVNDLQQELIEKQAKLNEILSRYNDELKILNPAPPVGHTKCPSCGASYIPGEMLFCTVCGNKLPTQNENTAKSNFSTEQPTIHQSTCSNCNTKNVSDAVFCISCGNKL